MLEYAGFALWAVECYGWALRIHCLWVGTEDPRYMGGHRGSTVCAWV